MCAFEASPPQGEQSLNGGASVVGDVVLDENLTNCARNRGPPSESPEWFVRVSEQNRHDPKSPTPLPASLDHGIGVRIPVDPAVKVVVAQHVLVHAGFEAADAERKYPRWHRRRRWWACVQPRRYI
jgi:hypothetical protein